MLHQPPTGVPKNTAGPAPNRHPNLELETQRDPNLPLVFTPKEFVSFHLHLNIQDMAAKAPFGLVKTLHSL